MADYLTNHLLIAMPTLADPNFSHTVTYVCEHNDEGALGIVINRPMDMRVREILSHLEIEPTRAEAADQPVYAGGPVQRERGFVLHEPLGHWEATLPVTDTIGLTASRDILAAIARGEGPPQHRIALGYAGWGAGQLEQEIVDNAWLSGPATARILFETPAEQCWQAAAGLLGVDLNLISGQAGHS
ncbi:MAG TPA: YqgE/AlgH family protein [Gammaproteobacteria bacterium]|nr:YqgE/AlgH family protein [Gammaproteobacteria bacterium]